MAIFRKSYRGERGIIGGQRWVRCVCTIPVLGEVPHYESVPCLALTVNAVYEGFTGKGFWCLRSHAEMTSSHLSSEDKSKHFSPAQGSEETQTIKGFSEETMTRYFISISPDQTNLIISFLIYCSQSMS